MTKQPPMTTSRKSSPIPPAASLGMFYGAMFLMVGIFLPFFPAWLKWRELEPWQIAIILSAPMLARIIFIPLVSLLADHVGGRRRVLIALIWGSLLSLAAMSMFSGFWPLLGVVIMFGMFWTPVMPLTEAIAMSNVKLRGLDYGRIRLWGSLSFIAASLGGGALIDHWGEKIILPLMLMAILLTATIASLLPREENRTSRQPGSAGLSFPHIDWREATSLARSKIFLLFLLTAAGIQSTHAIYYGFSALHWRSLHMSSGLIGFLWAVGVVAEISLFAWSGPVVRRLGPVNMLMIAAGGALIRWLLTAMDPPLALLIAAQCLHALSYGAAHIGAIHFISQAVPEDHSALGQGLYAAFAMGLMMGAMTSVSGSLYASLGASAYLVMAAMAGLSLAGAIILARSWHGSLLIEERKDSHH